MNVRPDLTIVIPSYNCADFVGRAVESAYEFTTRSFEVIVVDDGSTDGTKEVFADLTSRFSELQVVRQANGGLSNARNTGIRHAKGHYVVLLDADDQLLPVGELRILDIDPEMVRIALEEVGIDGTVLLHAEACGQSTGLEYLSAGFKHRRFYTPSCAYMYRLDWLRANELRFVDGLMHEDMLFTVQALLHCRCVATTDILGYRYFRRAGSITKTNDDVHTLNRINSLSRICTQLTLHVKAHPEIDLSWWVLNTIQYAANLARQTHSRLARWRVLWMEVRFFVANEVWQPYRTRKSTRYRLRQRLEEWLVMNQDRES